MTAEFNLPWPPSVNHYYRHAGSKHFISPDGKRYREKVIAMFRNNPHPVFKGEIALYAEFHPPDLKRRDLDNLLKCTQDSLQHAGLYADDSQISQINILRKEPKRPDGQVYVRLEDYHDETRK